MRITKPQAGIEPATYPIVGMFYQLSYWGVCPPGGRRRTAGRFERKETAMKKEPQGLGYTPTALLSHKYLAFLESLSNIKAVF